MATQYSPAIIQKFADKLYRRADSIVVSCTLFGIFFGGVGGRLLSYPLGLKDDSAPTIFGVVFFGLFGLFIGRARAFQLRLQAQVALCQKKIEENTRTERL